MGVGNIISKLKPSAEAKDSSQFSSQAATPARADSTVEKNDGLIDDSPVKYLTWRSFILGLCVSMGGFIFGYSTGQISGFTSMTDFKQRFGEYNGSDYTFSNVRNGLIVGLLSIGTMIGALVAAPIADRIGRKLSISFWALINIVGIIVQIASTDKWYQVALGRWVMGLGVGALSSVVPMYQSESAPRQVRGAMVSAFQLFVAFGIFISYIVNFGTSRMTHSTGSWRITMGVGFAWPLILGIGTLFLPESPRFAYRHGRVEEARSVMAKLYGVPTNHRVVAQEMADMKQKLDEELAVGTAPWHEVLTGPRMFHRTMLGIALQSLQQLTGANFIFYYGTSIFAGVGLSNSYVTSIILGAVNFGMTLPGLYIVEHYGRRNCLMIGAAWMFICFLIWASVGHEILHVDPGNHSAGVVMIVFTCFFIVGFATTWGPIVWAICGEMYPFRYRATCMGIATAANWTWNFLISFFTPFISSSIDYNYGYVFAACCFAAILVVFFFVNETQGRTLEEVDTMYVLHVKPWKSSSWVPPEGIIADLHAPHEPKPAEGGAGEHQHHDAPAEISEEQQ